MNKAVVDMVSKAVVDTVSKTVVDMVSKAMEGDDESVLSNCGSLESS